eukprot:879088_1
MLCSSIGNCPHLKRLVDTLKIYDGHMHNTEEKMINDMRDQINIPDTLNDYTHLLHHHDDDEEFEYVAAKLPNCNIKTCDGMMRIYRDRSKHGQNQPNGTLNAHQQILDKIHCYFLHSYDIAR